MKRKKVFAISGVFALVLGLLTGCKSSPPEDVDYYRRGLEKERAGDFARAVADYSAAIKRVPENAHAYCRRGYAKTMLDRPDRALADYNKAIALQPNVGEFYRFRAQLRYSTIEMDKALLDADKAIELDSKDWAAHDIRGGLLLIAASLEGVMAGLDKAEGLKGEEYVKVLQLNTPVKIKRTLLTAEEEFCTAITLAPNSGTTYANRGSARFLLGNLDGAIADFTKAIELEINREDRAHAYYSRGMIEVFEGNNEQALADLNKAIELNPQNGSAYSRRAEARKALGDTKGAASDLKQFQRLKKW